jgi:hypothetical protein
LNEAQQDQIMDWFGPNSNWMGGPVPIFPSVYYFLVMWGVQETTRSSGGSVFGFG